MSEGEGRRCLIVTAHPLTNSLCMHLADHAEAQARAAGWEVERLDLYRAGFAPALTAAERASTYAAKYESSAVSAEIAMLTRAEVIILVFPTWWFGLPAILKGWIDRVWAPGVAYDHAGDLGPIRGRLTGLTSFLAITTLGAPAWIDWLAMRRPVRRVLRWGLVKVCAPKAGFGYLALHSAENVSDDRLARFQSAIDRAIERL